MPIHSHPTPAALERILSTFLAAVQAPGRADEVLDALAADAPLCLAGSVRERREVTRAAFSALWGERREAPRPRFEQVEAIARDFHDAGLTPAEVAMMDFAVKISTDAAAMTDADAQVLRDHGFTDREIVDITLAAAVRNYYSRALHALGVEDPVPESMPAELCAALLHEGGR